MLSKLLILKDVYLSKEDGATAIEYGLIAAGIALAIVTVIFAFGDELGVTFGNMQSSMADANARLDGGGGGE